MVDMGKAVGKCLEFVRQFRPIDLWDDDSGFEARQNLAVQTPPILRSALLDVGVHLRRNVLVKLCWLRAIPATYSLVVVP
jgi:hypothetical protein